MNAPDGPSNPTRVTPPGGTPRGATAGDNRAVVWAETGAGDNLAVLLRRRGLVLEHVASAPAVIAATLREPPPSAVILVEPSRLQRAQEAVDALRTHAPAVRRWRFEGPPAGPGGAGLLEPVEGSLEHPLKLAPAPTPGAARSEPQGATGARLSRAELAMLLGPTRTLTTAGGDAG